MFEKICELDKKQSLAHLSTKFYEVVPKEYLVRIPRTTLEQIYNKVSLLLAFLLLLIVLEKRKGETEEVLPPDLLGEGRLRRCRSVRGFQKKGKGQDEAQEEAEDRDRVVLQNV